MKTKLLATNSYKLNFQPVMRMITTVNRPAILTFLILFTFGCRSPQLQLRVESPDFQLRSHAQEQIVLKSSGEPGQEVAGYLLVDGARQEVSGVSPIEIPLTTSVLVGQLSKLGGDGTLSFEIERAEQPMVISFGELTRPGSSLRFGYHYGGVEVRTE